MLKRYVKSGEADRSALLKTERARRCEKCAAFYKSLDATEGYIFCGVVATGLLQILSLRNARHNDMHSTRYQRTPSKSLASEATVGDCLRINIFMYLSNELDMTISQIIHKKMEYATLDLKETR